MIQRLGYGGDPGDRKALAQRLETTGLSAEACLAKAENFAWAAAALTQLGAGEPRWALFVPGRIEILGKHTDYAGGHTMVAAAERGFCLATAARSDRRVRVCDAACGETVEFELTPDLVPRLGHWSNYPMTVARRLARNFPGATRGADIAFTSDLPPAAGMSSSSALIVAIFLALAQINDLAAAPIFTDNISDLADLAGYLSTIENGHTFKTLKGDLGVGTFGGSEDHTAILNARPNHVSQYSYCPVRLERMIPIPNGYVLAVGSSGVAAEKTGAAMGRYNRASRRATRIAELWRQATGRSDPHLAAALASSPEAAGRLIEILQRHEPDEAEAEALLARLEHFLTENEQILPAAGAALAGGDLVRFGQLADHSQLAAEKLLGNQVPQTAYLALSARAAGANAASAFGAGFGGSVWALVHASQADAFLAQWSDSYRQQFPDDAPAALFFTTHAGPAAFQL